MNEEDDEKIQDDTRPATPRRRTTSPAANRSLCRLPVWHITEDGGAAAQTTNGTQRSTRVLVHRDDDTPEPNSKQRAIECTPRPMHCRPAAQPHASKLRTVRTHVSTHEAPPASNTTDTRPNSNRPTVRTHVSTHVPPASWTRLESDGTNCERTTPPLAANDSGAVSAASSSSHDASQPRKM